MKRHSILSMILGLFLVSCAGESHTVIVENISSVAREGEIIEISIDGAESFAVFNSLGEEIPSQVTYEGNLIFPATVEARGKSRYTLHQAEPSPIETIATGAIRPERIDDIAWENDRIGYRVYSKKAGRGGAKLYGYDIFTKRGDAPVLDLLYAVENDPHDRALVTQLRKSGETKAAQTLSDAISYHIDHGLGMDYYTVGPTLGCGTAALVQGGETIYPTYFSEYEILDEGGLRFSFKLIFDPVDIGGDMVVEERIITLDAGTHFNKVEVNYRSLTKPSEVIVGLVLHDMGEEHQMKGQSIAYAEPTHIYGWQTYNAVIFPEDMDAELYLFGSESREKHGGAYGHLQAKGIVEPNEPLVYHMGAGWNRWRFESAQDWFEYVASQEVALTTPLRYTIK